MTKNRQNRRVLDSSTSLQGSRSRGAMIPSQTPVTTVTKEQLVALVEETCTTRAVYRGAAIKKVLLNDEWWKIRSEIRSNGAFDLKIWGPLQSKKPFTSLKALRHYLFSYDDNLSSSGGSFNETDMNMEQTNASGSVLMLDSSDVADNRSTVQTLSRAQAADIIGRRLRLMIFRRSVRQYKAYLLLEALNRKVCTPLDIPCGFEVEIATHHLNSYMKHRSKVGNVLTRHTTIRRTVLH